MFSSKKANTGIERYIPWFRYWSISSLFLSRRKMRISMLGFPSTILASTGTL
jgi:hypothetical protein